METSETTTDSTTGEEFGALVKRMKAVLGTRVTDVVESACLTDNPVRLAVAEGGMGQELERDAPLDGRGGQPDCRTAPSGTQS